MNITMIVPYFKPEITAVVHLMADLAYDFAAYGANVTVITGFPLRGTSEEVRKEYFNKAEEKLADNLKILRVGSKNEENTILFIRGIQYIFKTYQFYKIARSIPTDVYYIYSTPPVAGVIGSFLSKKAPTLYALQDIFPDNLALQGKIKQKSILFKVFKAMERYIYKNNTCIVTISNDMKQTLVDKKVDENKISIIGNWIDTEEIKHVARELNPIFDEFKLDRNKFYVTYCGNLGYAQDLKIILESAKILAEKQSEIELVFIGSGVLEKQIKKQITEEKINNIHIFPLQPEEASACVYSLGDVGLITLAQDMCRYAMPSKTWTMMSAAQPIICTAVKNTQLYEIIDQNKSGVIVTPGDSEGLAQQILNLYQNRDRLKTYSENERTYAVRNLSRENATKAYFELLKGMAEN